MTCSFFGSDASFNNEQGQALQRIRLFSVKVCIIKNKKSVVKNYIIEINRYQDITRALYDIFVIPDTQYFFGVFINYKFCSSLKNCRYFSWTCQFLVNSTVWMSEIEWKWMKSDSFFLNNICKKPQKLEAK